eukprot:967318-Rhodomonas_salina.1
MQAVTRLCHGVTVEWRRRHVCQGDRGSVWRRHMQRERGSVRKTQSYVTFECRRTSPLIWSEPRKRLRHWRSSWAELGAREEVGKASDERGRESQHCSHSYLPTLLLHHAWD